LDAPEQRGSSAGFEETYAQGKRGRKLIVAKKRGIPGEDIFKGAEIGDERAWSGTRTKKKTEGADRGGWTRLQGSVLEMKGEKGGKLQAGFWSELTPEEEDNQAAC